MGTTTLRLALCFLAAPAFGAGSAKVVKVTAKPTIVFVSHGSGQPWKAGDGLCIKRKNQELACGKVLKANSQLAGVMLTLTKDAPKIAVGDGVEASAAHSRTPASTSSKMAVGKDGKPKFSRWQIAAEGLGAAFFYQIFATYRFSKHIGVNVGGSFLAGSTTPDPDTGLSVSASVLQFPVSVSAFIGGGDNSFFEVNGGVDLAFMSGTAGIGSFSFGSADGMTLVPEFGVGYRYWKLGGGLTFRAMGYVLLLPSQKTVTDEVVEGTGGLNFWGGLSLGYAF
jgi:hypothetical protein